MTESGIAFYPADILIPKKGSNFYKWSVIACDQFTSDPSYWHDVEKIAEGSPSSLNIIFPEIYLEVSDASARIGLITRTMENYLERGVFETVPLSYILSERKLVCGRARIGLVGMLDLEHYDYLPTATSLVRATEGTVLERIPPRIAIRENAPIECPHVMLLIDDPENTVIAPVFENRHKLPLLFDTELMKNGGHLTGYRVCGGDAANVEKALYNLLLKKPSPPLLYAVGDGNHSLATALECYRSLKKEIGGAAKSHPGRFAMCEIVNIHDSSLEFEPIHRVLFGVNPADVIKKLKNELGAKDGNGRPDETLLCISADFSITFNIENRDSELLVGKLQKFLDGYMLENGGKTDYIHGLEETKKLGKSPSNIGFILPDVKKDNFFDEIMKNGPYPRKTFSMGEAHEKRYYFECRKIK